MSSKYCKYIEKLKNNFIEIYKKPYTEDEYFKVITKAWYINYEGDIEIHTEKGVPISYAIRKYVETVKTKRGIKSIPKQVTGTKLICVWAVKKPNGIYEMVTGMKLYPIPAENYLCCYGIEPVEGMEIVRLTEDLQFFASKPSYKSEYITKLNKASAEARKDYFERKRQVEEERQAPIVAAQKQEAAKQYLKKYNLPDNN